MNTGELTEPQVELQNASDSASIPCQQDFLNWVTIASSNKKPNSEVSIRIVDKIESQSLNKQYRGLDKPTNVLSFPAEFPEGVDIPFLGDLVICAPIVEAEARAQNKSIAAHWAHMVIHGTLHLLGYDHIEDDEAETMEALEIALLAKLDVSSPY
jgi:probable rRNA maturation factor